MSSNKPISQDTHMNLEDLLKGLKINFSYISRLFEFWIKALKLSTDFFLMIFDFLNVCAIQTIYK